MAGKKRGRRRYTDEDRANALAALAANGGNLSRTAAQIGIPAKTLENWTKGTNHPHAAKLGELKKPALAEQFRALAEKLVGIACEKADRLNAKDAVIAAGVAIDKARLLDGEPTQINEQRDDVRLAEFRRRYGSGDAPGDAGADARSQPADPPPPDAATDPLP
jgi:transposase-like protein